MTVVHYRDSDEEGITDTKKPEPYVFKTKKEAIEAFKMLLRDKVQYLKFFHVLAKKNIWKCS